MHLCLCRPGYKRPFILFHGAPCPVLESDTSLRNLNAHPSYSLVLLLVVRVLTALAAISLAKFAWLGLSLSLSLSLCLCLCLALRVLVNVRGELLGAFQGDGIVCAASGCSC